MVCGSSGYSEASRSWSSSDSGVPQHSGVGRSAGASALSCHWLRWPVWPSDASSSSPATLDWSGRRQLATTRSPRGQRLAGSRLGLSSDPRPHQRITASRARRSHPGSARPSSHAGRPAVRRSRRVERPDRVADVFQAVRPRPAGRPRCGRARRRRAAAARRDARERRRSPGRRRRPRETTARSGRPAVGDVGEQGGEPVEHLRRRRALVHVPHRRPLGERDRLGVTDDRVSAAARSRLTLDRNAGEHGRRRDPGSGRDLRDRRARVALLTKRPARSPGSARGSPRACARRPLAS